MTLILSSELRSIPIFLFCRLLQIVIMSIMRAARPGMVTTPRTPDKLFLQASLIDWMLFISLLTEIFTLKHVQAHKASDTR